MPRSLFTSSSGQQSLTTGLEQVGRIVEPITGIQANPDSKVVTYGAPHQFLVTAPSSYPDNDTAASSVTSAWRDTLWHVIVGQAFANNADIGTINNALASAHSAAKILEGVAPDSGAYQNRADVFQDDHIEAFWGQEN